MNEANSIWDEVLGQPLDERTSNVVPFMNGQCDELYARSGGLINARFAEIKLRQPVQMSAHPEMERFAEMMRSQIPQAPIDENALGLSDAGKLYAAKRYGFDVYNSTYEFRAFAATIGALYPIRLTIDETIAKESNEALSPWLGTDDKPNVATIRSDDDLRSCFYAIVRSRKMRFVLNALRDDQ